MATIPIVIPDSLIPEFQAIATQAGFSTPKAMFIAYLKAQIRAYRGNKAVVGLREAAEAQAATDTAGIA